MKFLLTSGKLTGNPGPSGWAQVHEFIPDDADRISSRGHLYAVISTSGEVVTRIEVGRELLSRLHEEYFGNNQLTPYNALEACIKKVTAEFSSLLGTVTISAISVVDDIVYSSASGGGEVWVYRNGMFAKILGSTKEGVVSASGYPNVNDLLLLGTASFFETIHPDKIKASLESLDPKVIVETLAPELHSEDDAASLGVVIVKFAEESVLSEVIQVPGKELKFSGLFASVYSKISRFIPRRSIYIKNEYEGEGNRRKVTVSIGLILLILLLVSIVFGVRQRSAKTQKERYETRLLQAQHDYEEAVNLIALNPERARELFVSSREEAERLTSEKVTDPTLSTLIENLDQSEGQILGEYEENTDLFVDLSLLSSGFNGNELVASSDNIFVLDKNGKKVAKVSMSTKKSEIVAGPGEVEGAISLAAYEDRVFIETSSGITEVSEGKSEVIKKDWQGEILAYAYAGNIYILDKGEGEISRYVGGGTSFGSKQGWLAEGTTVDFSSGQGLTIDGAIYVRLQTARILKFSQGAPQQFSILGVFPEINKIDAFYTNEDNNFIYLLEKEAKRVVVLDKSGNFKAQYKIEKAGEAQGLAVSEKEKKIIILIGGQLHSVETKHL